MTEARRPRPFHPIFFGLYPVLSLYAPNTGLVPPQDILLPLTAVFLGTLALWGILRLLLRDAERSASVASAAVVGIFSFGPVMDLVRSNESGEVTGMTRHDLFMLWAPVLLVVLLLAAWKGRGPITRGLNVAGVILVVWPAVTIGSSWIAGSNAPKGATAIKDPIAESYKGSKPDIYYIILDGYGRSDAVRRSVGLDNSEFLDGLRKLGFIVEGDTRSNYCQTELSLSSSLNLDYVQTLLPEGITGENRAPLDRLIDRNRIAATLRGFGYKFIAITSGFPGVHPNSADLLISEARTGSLFEGALTSRTPIGGGSIVATSAFDRRRQDLAYAIDRIGKLGSSSQPRFVFAHILAPHPPFVFGPNGEAIRPKNMQFGYFDGSHFMQNGGSPETYANGYRGQATAIGRMLLKSLQELVRNSKTPPIVVVQGDHGSKLHLDQDTLVKTDINEVFPILNAYLVPDKIRQALYPTITPVNSFRTILREQFGEPFPNLPDRSWYSSWLEPTKFEEVTDRIH